MLGQNAFPLNKLALRIRRVLSSPAAWAAAACLPGLAHAGPTGGNVVAGSAAVSRPDANTTVIDQGTDKAIINWQSFSIGGKEYVQFVQPATSSIALNRVVGGDPSQILGSLSANGRVFLVNPHGIYFGPGATIDVGGLVASVQDIKDEDFLAGRYVFARSPSSPDGTGVVNDGVINARDGGFVVLAGDYVKNTGVIRARLGTAVLASGRALTLNLDNDGLVSFAVDEATVSHLAGVENAGQILADGGRVLMTAKVADGLVATAVNNSGLVQAHSIVEKNGAIFLRAAGGNIENSGTLDASGLDGAAGGAVIVSGDQDATLEAGSMISADGSGAAGGGMVRIVADGKLTLRQGSTVSAQGGSQDGKGGLIELSGHGGLDMMNGTILVGRDGELLIDPTTLTITSGSSAGYGGTGASNVVGENFISNELNSGTNVTLIASSLITRDGTATAGINASAPSYAGNLTLKIGTVTYSSYGGSLGYLGGGCSNGICTTGTSYSFAPGTTGDISLSGYNINIRGGVTLQAGTLNGSVAVGNVTSATAGVTIRGGTSSGTVNTGNISGNGNVSVTAHDGITVGSVTAASSSLQIQSTAGPVTVNGSATLTGSGVLNLSVQGGGAVNVTGLIKAQQIGGAASDGVTVRVNGSGLTVHGVQATGVTSNGLTWVRLNASGSGDANLDGPVSVTTSGATATASFFVFAGHDANINSTVNVSANGGRASASFGAYHTLAINGAITATGSGPVTAVHLHGPSIQITAPVQVVGPSSADIYLQPYSFGSYQALTTGSGILKATTGAVVIDGGEGSTPSVVNVKTDTPQVDLYYPSFTGAPTSVTVDNTAFTGAASLNVGMGPYASSSSAAFGDLAFTFGGPGSVTGAPIYASSFKVMVDSGDLSVAGTTIYTTGMTDLSAPAGNINAAGASISATSSMGMSAPAGNVNVAGALLSAGGELSIVAGGNIQNAPAAGATLDAGSLVLEAGGSIALESSSVNIDTGTVPVGSDSVLQDFMSVLGIASPGTNPNAYFRAGGNVALGSLTAYATYPYLVFQVGGTVNPGSVSTPNASEILAAFQAAAGTNVIGVADTSSAPASCAGGACTTNFFNDIDFSVWKGTTIAVGSGTQTGDIYIDPINIGSKNFLCLTTGRCFGLTNVQSTGIVAALVGVVNTFNLPLPDEFGEGEEKLKYLFQQGEEGGGGAGSVTYNTSQGLTCE